MSPTPPANIDAYIASYPQEVQQILEEVRATIRTAIPQAAETIKYGIPTFVLLGNLISFAAYKNHIGVYPIPAGDERFQTEIAPFKNEKSTARFPLDRPIPYDLIARLAGFRASEQHAYMTARGKTK